MGVCICIGQGVFDQIKLKVFAVLINALKKDYYRKRSKKNYMEIAYDIMYS